MSKDDKIFVAGHRGLVGSAIVRKLKNEGYSNIITKTRSELDLLDQKKVSDFFNTERPDFVFLAAAKVGGIMANKNHPAEFIYENLSVQNNVIHNAYLTKVKKLIFLGSSCIYPRLSPQPINESYLLSGPLEPTNQSYAIAKIAGIIMCQSYNRQYGTNFISVMPTNLYGENDNFELETSHVLPALIHKIHKAKINNQEKIILWGTGSAKREFLHVDDLAEACLFSMKKYDDSEILNIGTGVDVSIKELAEIVISIIGYKGKIEWDASKPDGMPRKLLDVSKIEKLGWKSKIKLEDGIKMTYKWFLENYKEND